MYIKIENENCQPHRANPTDAGLDLKAKNHYTLLRGVRTLVATGVRVKIPPHHVGLLFPRSSLSKSGIVMTNSVGVIDSDYRGEVMASLMYNGSMEMVEIQAGERVVQLVVVPIAIPLLEYSDESEEQWNNTVRGTGGFGSTGKI
jgi:dUTP pyrophosphatase